MMCRCNLAFLDLGTFLSYVVTLQITRELCGTILTRPAKLCNFIDWRGQKVAYKRWDEVQGIERLMLNIAKWMLARNEGEGG